jgi:hypothetical protein
MKPLSPGESFYFGLTGFELSFAAFGFGGIVNVEFNFARKSRSCAYRAVNRTTISRKYFFI